MRRYWQKKPLLIRGAITGFGPVLDRNELVDLAAQEAVESRLVAQTDSRGNSAWRFKHGPFTRRMLPPFKQSAWTLLVQGVDLHDERLHRLLTQFRFVPEARLDDVMISYATDGGGVGPHFDSYDVFLLQAQGTRRWSIGRQKDLRLKPDMPLKILAHFEPEQEFDLEPGDMLYLPPRYAHDGIAQGECMTYSIGFRAPAQGELVREILQRIAEHAGQESPPVLYRDPDQPAVSSSARVPLNMLGFAERALQAALADPKALAQSLGEYLTEPKAHVWFDANPWRDGVALHLDRRTRMMYDDRHVFINGESFRAAGTDAKLMRVLADTRALQAKDAMRLSQGARDLLSQWCEDGWLYADH